IQANILLDPSLIRRREEQGKGRRQPDRRRCGKGFPMRPAHGTTPAGRGIACRPAANRRCGTCPAGLALKTIALAEEIEWRLRILASSAWRSWARTWR